MGWRENLQTKVEDQMQDARERGERSRETAAVSTSTCPDPSKHYQTEVNKGSIRMQTWEADLNWRFQQGYRLAHVYEIAGNTVQVYEHNHP